MSELIYDFIILFLLEREGGGGDEYFNEEGC